MDYMLLILSPRDEAEANESERLAEMGQFAAALSQQGKRRSGARLHGDDRAVRVSVRGGSTRSIDGPFAESKEVLGGFLIVDAASRAEAIELAKRCPAARWGTVQVEQAMTDRVPEPPSAGTRYMLVFVEGPDFGGDPDGAKYREMERWTDELKRERSYVECAGLVKDPPAARVQVRAGRAAVSDGPFAESKEVVGGYAIVDAPDRAAALALARRCPHAGWGEVEVREVAKIPPA